MDGMRADIICDVWDAPGIDPGGEEVVASFHRGSHFPVIEFEDEYEHVVVVAGDGSVYRVPRPNVKLFRDAGNQHEEMEP